MLVIYISLYLTKKTISFSFTSFRKDHTSDFQHILSYHKNGNLVLELDYLFS